MGLAAKYKKKSDRTFKRAEKLAEKARRIQFKISMTGNPKTRLILGEQVRRLEVKIRELNRKGDKLWEIGDDIYMNAHG